MATALWEYKALSPPLPRVAEPCTLHEPSCIGTAWEWRVWRARWRPDNQDAGACTDSRRWSVRGPRPTPHATALAHLLFTLPSARPSGVPLRYDAVRCVIPHPSLQVASVRALTSRHGAHSRTRVVYRSFEVRATAVPYTSSSEGHRRFAAHVSRLFAVCGFGIMAWRFVRLAFRF
jgi:hypothetical protein